MLIFPYLNFTMVNPKQSKRKTKPAAPRRKPTVTTVAIPRPRPQQATITQDGARFVKCSLHPLMATSMKSVGVPDRYSGDTVVLDHKMTVTVVNGSLGTMKLLALPTLPGALWIYGETGGSDIPGGYTTVTGTTGTAVHNGNYYQCIPFQEYLPPNAISYTPGAHVLPNMNVYNATHARCVALALEVKDKSNSLNSQGDITCTRFPWRVGSQALIGKADKPGGSATGYYWQRTVDPPLSNKQDATAYKSYTCFPVKEGAYSVATRTKPDWDMMEFAPVNSNADDDGTWLGQWWDLVLSNSAFAGGAFNTTSAIQYGVSTVAPANGDTIGPSWVDDGTSGIAMVIDGLNTTTPQALEVTITICVEYEVRPTSSISKFLAPSPKEDPVAMKIVSDTMSQLPSAVPQKQNSGGGFWDKVKGIIGKVVGGIEKAIPIVSQVAGVASKIATML